MLEEHGTPAPGGSEPEPQPQAPAPAPAAVTPEDPGVLKARLEEKESFIGRQSKEIGDLRNQLGYLQSMVEGIQTARPSEPVRETPSPPSGTPADFFDRPMDYVDRRVEEKLRTIEERRQKQDMDSRAREAQSNFYDGKEQAYKTDKRLYEGIEQEVERALHESYRAGILNERSLASPKTWQRAAQLIHLERGEFDRLTPPAPKPVAATQTETPSGRPMQYGDVSVEVDEDTRRWGRGQGLSDKQIEELIRKEAGARGKGQNIARQGYGD